MQLAPEAASAGYRLHAIEATGSTNDDALSAATGGDPGMLWIVAREQRAGRGRHGRTWTSPPGNLYASLLLVEPCDMAVAPQLGFVAGLALHDAVQAVTGTGVPRLALKWPNDLLLDGAKVAGLLLEGHRLPTSDLFAIIIGFGVNVASAPDDTPYPAATLQQCRAGVGRGDVFAALSRAFAGAFGAFASQRTYDPFAAVRRLWTERAAGLGTEVSVRLPSGTRRGRFDGLDDHGRLQLVTDRGVELIDAGDLYFPSTHRETAPPVSAR